MFKVNTLYNVILPLDYNNPKGLEYFNSDLVCFEIDETKGVAKFRIKKENIPYDTDDGIVHIELNYTNYIITEIANKTDNPEYFL